MTAHLIAEDGPLQGLILHLTDGNEWIVGRSTDAADLIIDDSTVSRKHAKIFRNDEGIHVKNVSKVNPTLVNGEEFRGSRLLKEGDRVQFGETTFLFSEEDIPNIADKKKGKAKQQNYDDIFSELDVAEEEAIPSEGTLEETVQAKGRKEEDTSYDTVFEDASDMGQVPFNLPSDTPYLLKVVSGPNAGAEIAMERGHVYTLGKDSKTCDILFQDLSVSRTHARVSISEEGMIEIEDLGSRNGTAINGVPITGKHIVTSQDLLSLGTTVFLIIDREAPQETIDASIVPARAAENAPEEAPKMEEAKDWKTQPIPYKHLIIAGSIAAIFLIAFVSFFSLFKTKDTELVHKEPVEQIKEALQGDKFSDVQYSFNPASGKLFLVGHVMTAVDYQEMRHSLSRVPFIMSIEDNVVIDEGVSRETNEILSANPDWNGIYVRAITPGKFVVIGYLKTSAEMTALNDYLTLNFPYLDRLENTVAVEDVLNTEVASMLMQGGFSAVTYQLNNGEVILSGVYDRNKEREFEELQGRIRKQRSITTLKNFAIPTSPQMAALDISSHFAVSGITLHDKKGVNAIINGKLYGLGDAVDGMDITQIEEKTILLEKDGVKYRIDFTP